MRRLVLRNAMFLTAAQVIGMPLSIALNAVQARYLGPVALGYMYLGTTFNSFGFLAVDWGQGGALPALVAQDRSRAGQFLGTSLLWQSTVALAVFGLLTAFRGFLGYNLQVQTAISLVFIGSTLSALTNACQYTIFGFERTDVAAKRQVIEQILSLLVVVPILFAGGQLSAVLIGHAVVMVFVFAYAWRALRSTPVGPLSIQWDALKALLRRGTPFVFLNLAMVLQPNIDAIFLSKIAPPAVLGWSSAAQRLIGVLVFPAAVLVGALYPTLCRLYTTNVDEFRTSVGGALRGTSLLAIPIALGCALFPDVGISIYSRGTYGPAEGNLRVSSMFLLLVYLSMPIGTGLLAAGKQRRWALVQSAGVLMSCLLDPLLIPWFQRRTGNGGLGVCWVSVVSEFIVVVCGIFMSPSGTFDRGFWRSFALAAISGGGMALVAYGLRPFGAFAAAPASVAAYVLILWLTGAVEKAHIAAGRAFLGRKFARFRDKKGAT